MREQSEHASLPSVSFDAEGILHSAFSLFGGEA